MRRPCSESSMRVARRRALVSSFLALMTHQIAGFRYDGGCASKNAHAFLSGSELTGLRAVEADSILLERVLIRARDVSLVERALTGGLDAFLGSEFGEASDVLGAPDAAGTSRREADRVAVLVEAAPHAVNPTEAHRLVDRLRPCDARLAGAPLVETGEQLVAGLVVFGQPRAEPLRRREEPRFRRHWVT